jgi:glycosyltransferase involved in cell wall biosynthesis
MIIAYDGHIFRWQRFGGISRYFSELITRLPSDLTPLVIGADATSALPLTPKLRLSHRGIIRPRRISQCLKRAWWTHVTLRSASIFHPTYYHLASGLRLSDFRLPIVVTVHDFAHASYSGLMDDIDDTVRYQSAAIERADHIICVSHFTKTDLLTRFPRVESKVSVIYHGASLSTQLSPSISPLIEPTTFLYVGGRGGYKNFAFLLRAFSKAAQTNTAIRLHIAGRRLTEDERWGIYFCGLSGRVTVSEFPDEIQLAALYRTSVALLYPSFHEGFGIPALEAMACGTIPITSNRTSLPEVVGDAGIMLDPTDERAWADSILAVAEGGMRRTELLARGRRRAASFSWDACAQKHATIYRHLAGQ